ncbi:MAG: DUF1189 family protein [Rickettsiales bacterium]
MKFFNMFFGAFYSTELYRTLRHEGKYALGYSFKLVMLMTLIMLISGTVILHRFAFAPQEGQPPRFDVLVQQVARQLPNMTLHHGVLKTDQPEATTISVDIAVPGEESESFALAIIDTSGATKPTKTEVPIVIDDTNIYITTKEKTEIHPLGKFFEKAPETLIINRALIDDQATRLIAWTHASLTKIYLMFGALTWVMLVVFNYIGRLVLLAILAGTASAIASARGKSLSFAQAMAVAAVSFTPIAVIDAISFAMTAAGVSAWLLVLGGAVALMTGLRLGDTAPPNSPA